MPIACKGCQKKRKSHSSALLYSPNRRHRNGNYFLKIQRSCLPNSLSNPNISTNGPKLPTTYSIHPDIDRRSLRTCGARAIDATAVTRLHKVHHSFSCQWLGARCSVVIFKKPKYPTVGPLWEVKTEHSRQGATKQERISRRHRCGCLLRLVVHRQQATGFYQA